MGLPAILYKSNEKPTRAGLMELSVEVASKDAN
jgi:hypothetical protein